MKYPTVIIPLLFLFALTAYSQNTTPAIFKWQDKHSKKRMFKYIHHDTIIKNTESSVHITYNNSPQKPYLLLLHGMGVNARSNWGSQIKALSQHFNLILPDLIYFGESTSESGNFSIEFQAQQIHETVLKLGITQKINVMGFSYGGLTAAVYNELYQTEVIKLIIIDGPVKFFSREMADSCAQSYGISNLHDLLVPTTIKDFNGLQQASMVSALPITKRLKRKLIKHVFGNPKPTRDKQINYLVNNQPKFQSLNYNLDKTTTLLIWGGQDGLVPLCVGKSLHNAFPNTTQLLVFPKAKHDVHFKYKKKLNKAVVEFLK